MYPDDGIVIAMTVNMSTSPMNAGTAETIGELFLNARTPERTTSRIDAEGSYEFSAVAADGRKLTGTLELVQSKSGYVGRIVPRTAPAGPIRRAQDGSYAPPQPIDIDVVRVSVNGSNVHVVGADSNGFVQMRFFVKGDAVSGQFAGRGISGMLTGVRKRATAS